MADNPKTTSPTSEPTGSDKSKTNISPGIADVIEGGKTDPGTTQPKTPTATASTLPADKLPDGTIPTLLKPGSSYVSVSKKRASLASVYRRADLLTTLITLGAAIAAALIVIGIYAYLTRSKTTPTKAPPVTSLDKTSLDKLGAYFVGNPAGGADQVLTISAATLFNNRVAMSSDLKVVGNTQISGATTLGDVVVNKTSTLGVTNVHGSLTIAGPLSLQSPATLGAGATITGNLTVTGNGTFGGTLAASTVSARDVTVSGTLNLNGHISISGQSPTAIPASNLTSSASVDGSDASGTVTVVVPPTSGTTTGAQLVRVNFRNAYARVPHIVITPIGRSAALLQPFITKDAAYFSIGAANFPADANATSYSFDYWIVQ